MIKPGDIIKIKFRGMKTKFQILGPLDIITEDCFQQQTLREPPMCYSETLSYFNKDNDILESGCFGDYVYDEHTTRVYLKMLPW